MYKLLKKSLISIFLGSKNIVLKVFDVLILQLQKISCVLAFLIDEGTKAYQLTLRTLRLLS